MLISTVFSGFGGQGIIMMAQLLATAGMYEAKNVTCLPSYGAEVRGGTANCTVIVSSDEIASPVASEPGFAVLLNNPSLFRFQDQVAPGGALFLNSSLVTSRPVRHDLEVYEVPVNELAKSLPGNRGANMIMLGAFLKRSRLVAIETVTRVLEETFGTRNPAVLASNQSALRLGHEYLK
jgi:2-oxoglutarate ferredoxin oxidoreductase subunit gamma